MILAHLTQAIHPTSLAFFQEQTVGFSPLDLWNNMGLLAKCVVLILFIMSIWSLAVMIDRWLYFSAARKQSREFAPRVAGALKEGKLDEAVKVADRNKKSHLAEVVTAGLQEFRNYGSGGAVTEDQIESSKRALERAEAIVHAKLKRGLGRSGYDWLDGSVYRTVRNGYRYLERIPSDRNAEDLGYRCGRRWYLGSSRDYRIRSAGRYPGRYDVQLLHQQGGSVRRRDGQLLERIDRLLPQAGRPSLSDVCALGSGNLVLRSGANSNAPLQRFSKPGTAVFEEARSEARLRGALEWES